MEDPYSRFPFEVVIPAGCGTPCALRRGGVIGEAVGHALRLTDLPGLTLWLAVSANEFYTSNRRPGACSRRLAAEDYDLR